MFRTLIPVAVFALAVPVPATAAPVPEKAKDKPTDALDRIKPHDFDRLIRQPAVLKALGLTRDQEKKLGEARAAALATIKAAVLADTGDPNAPDLVEKATAEASDTFDRAVLDLLAPGQRRTLKLAWLQARGPEAFADHRLSRVLGLTDDQQDAIGEELRPWRRHLLENGGFFLDFIGDWDGDEDIDLKRAAELFETTRAAVLKHLTKEQKTKWREVRGPDIPVKELLMANGTLLRKEVEKLREDLDR